MAWPFLAAAGIGAAGNLFGSMLGAGIQHDNAMEQMRYAMGLQNAQQEKLRNSQYNAMVSGMKNSGLNPATANGTTPVTPSAGSPSSNAGMPQMNLGDAALGAMSTMLNLKSGMEDVKAKKLDNQLKALDVENAKAEQEENNTFRRYTDPDTGEEISPENVNSWSDAHPGKLLNIEVTKRKGGKGILRSELFKGEFKSKMRDFRQSIDNADTLAVYNELQRKINQGKLDHKDVMDALSKLPKAEYDQVIAATNELNKRADLEELQGKELDATQISTLMEKLQDKKMSAWDKFLATLAWTLGRFAKR